MSFTHHSAEEQEARDRLLDEFLHKAREHHSDGRLNKDDKGDLSFAMATDPKNKVIILQFSKPIHWVGMPLKQAMAVRDLLNEHIEELSKL